MIQVNLYKRNSNGEPVEWWIRSSDKGDTGLGIGYGKVGYRTHLETVDVTMQSCKKEFESRIAAKKKEGYKELQEIYDNAPQNLDDKALYNFLDTYLPKFNNSSNGASLAMLAKTLEDNKPFEKYGMLRGQWKINGERCIVGARQDTEDMFNPIKLTFHSRTGTEWKLPYLEGYLLTVIPKDMLDMMIEEGAQLDGELYLPGYNINEINHFIKNPTAPQHKLLQYWLYDFAMESMKYDYRRMILSENFGQYSDNDYTPKFNSKNDHLNNKQGLIYLPEMIVGDYNSAIAVRDNFIDLGFEGLILRNPEAEYDFGARRVGHMYKFKKILDGKFQIVDIVPEGKKRQNLGKFVLKNDINDSTFECTYNAPHGDQEFILIHRDTFIGKYVKVEYRERSGVEQVPFHAKAISIL